jgi:formate dehydrogenase iron-sulfur subunit
MPFQLAGNIKRGGLVEKAFGHTARADRGFRRRHGHRRPVRAVQVGGPLGAYFPESLLDTPLDYEDFRQSRRMLGHGGWWCSTTPSTWQSMARFAMEFCAIESCGKCTPCRIGSVRGVEVIDRIVAAESREKERQQLLKDLCDTMEAGSLCAMGGLTPIPVHECSQTLPRRGFPMNSIGTSRRTEPIIFDPVRKRRSHHARNRLRHARKHARTELVTKRSR